MLRKSSLENAFDVKFVQNVTVKANAKEIFVLKMHLAQHMCKTVTLKANAKEIFTWKCIWHHICAKLLLWRQILRKSLLENAFVTTYVQNSYFEGKY